MSEHKYTMNISLNVLNHLGINLYSNTPAVLAEVIANAWDAGATRVDIQIEEDSITISDNGCGMSEKDINEKFLCVGYQRRESGEKIPYDRNPMGRKGIGKLSLFSIAKKIHVYSRKGEEKNALLMDVGEIEKIIDDKSNQPYHPKPLSYEEGVIDGDEGTAIVITDLRKKLTQATINGLRRRIARRFSVIGEKYEFKVFINGDEITYADRDYFEKARFLFQYGDDNSSVRFNKLDSHEGKKAIFSRLSKFNDEGVLDEKGNYQIKGWVAIAHRSNDLDEEGGSNKGDNLNNIVIVVRGKVAQEDILHEFRIGSLFTKYIYGEIEADFLDEDGEDDIATSSRQKIMEDAPRYQALKNFMGSELRHIRTITDNLKTERGIQKALDYHPKIKEWYEGYEGDSRKKINSLFGKIEQIETDEEHRKTLYVNSILAFEKMDMDSTLSILEEANPDIIDNLLQIFKKVDDLEAAHYHEIITSRLKVIEKLRDLIDNNAKERAIQDHIYDHLWLLDPAWERATIDEEKEKHIQLVIDKVKERESEKVQNLRIDIRYRRVSGVNVIIELKRASVALEKTEVEAQIKKYRKAVKADLLKSPKYRGPIESICIVGEIKGWDDQETREEDIQSLTHHDIRILTYIELIDNAQSAYSKFITDTGRKKVGRLRNLIKEIRDIDSDKEEK